MMMQGLYGVPMREAYFVDTYVEAGFEEASLKRAGISLVMGRMKKANYRRVAPPHDMVGRQAGRQVHGHLALVRQLGRGMTLLVCCQVTVHCQGGVDSRITALLMTRGLGLREELPDRLISYKVARIVLMYVTHDRLLACMHSFKEESGA